MHASKAKIGKKKTYSCLIQTKTVLPASSAIFIPVVHVAELLTALLCITAQIC